MLFCTSQSFSSVMPTITKLHIRYILIASKNIFNLHRPYDVPNSHFSIYLQCSEHFMVNDIWSEAFFLSRFIISHNSKIYSFHWVVNWEQKAEHSQEIPLFGNWVYQLGKCTHRVVYVQNIFTCVLDMNCQLKTVSSTQTFFFTPFSQIKIKVGSCPSVSSSCQETSTSSCKTLEIVWKHIYQLYIPFYVYQCLFIFR